MHCTVQWGWLRFDRQAGGCQQWWMPAVVDASSGCQQTGCQQVDASRWMPAGKHPFWHRPAGVTGHRWWQFQHMVTTLCTVEHSAQCTCDAVWCDMSVMTSDMTRYSQREVGWHSWIWNHFRYIQTKMTPKWRQQTSGSPTHKMRETKNGLRDNWPRYYRPNKQKTYFICIYKLHVNLFHIINISCHGTWNVMLVCRWGCMAGWGVNPWTVYLYCAELDEGWTKGGYEECILLRTAWSWLSGQNFNAF